MSSTSPLSLLDASVGKYVTVLMRGDREFFGKVDGFDDYVNIVLSDVTEKWVLSHVISYIFLELRSHLNKPNHLSSTVTTSWVYA